MLKLSHKTLYLIAGCVWLAIGIMLLNMGLKFLIESAHESSKVLFIDILSSLISVSDRMSTVVVMIALGLLLGYAKGRYVLLKTVRSTVERIGGLSDPAPLSQLYTKGNVILIAAMMGLGMLMRILHVPLDVRGLVDVAVGSALINGSVSYIKLFFQPVSELT